MYIDNEDDYDFFSDCDLGKNSCRKEIFLSQFDNMTCFDNTELEIGLEEQRFRSIESVVSNLEITFEFTEPQLTTNLTAFYLTPEYLAAENDTQR